MQPGDNVAVIGVGGIGAAAIQGARLAGAERIFAIDPVPLKRELAPRFGATHTFASVEEAFEPIQAETWGRMCDKVICAMGVGRGSLISLDHGADRQAGTGGGHQHPPDGRDRGHAQPVRPDA